MILKTEFTFDAAHKLNGYDGKCANLHGHQWRVVIWVEGSKSQLDDVGILWDFTNVKKLEEKLDHTYLNEVLGFNPTAESICNWIITRLILDNPKFRYKVRVYESPKSYCEDER